VSNHLGVAAVTKTLVGLLDPWIHKDPELADTRVTAAPPDKARDNGQTNQLNVFLYHAALSPAWRNMALPSQTNPNETGPPPLPLNLYYLLTAYGRDNSDDLGHRVLGRAMLLLHDHPVLGAAEIKAALADNDLWQQVERIRITPQPLTIDEMSKLWTTFQTQYRISVAYEVAVVLVESTRASITPLPVLSRSPDALASSVPRFPTVEAVEIPDGRPSVFLGDGLVVTGHDLAGDTVRVVFDSPRLDEPKRVAPAAGATGSSVPVALPNDAAAKASWPPGLYTVAVEVTDAGPPERVRTSNSAPLRLAPVLTGALPLNVPIITGTAAVTVTFDPEVLPEQRVSLLLSDRQVPSPPRAAKIGTITFDVTDAEPGECFVRLRADGVDSIPIDFSTDPPTFRQDQKVVLT
jgi:Pvc16 N-terminal domain